MVLDVILCRKTRVVNIVHNYKHDMWCYTTFFFNGISRHTGMLEFFHNIMLGYVE